MNTIPVRQIDQTPPPDRYARGWHCLGLSASFRDKPKAKLLIALNKFIHDKTNRRTE